jgi:hypothetical protein
MTPPVLESPCNIRRECVHTYEQNTYIHVLLHTYRIHTHTCFWLQTSSHPLSEIFYMTFQSRDLHATYIQNAYIHVLLHTYSIHTCTHRIYTYMHAQNIYIHARTEYIHTCTHRIYTYAYFYHNLGYKLAFIQFPRSFT